MKSPVPLPVEIHRSAQRGELQKVVKWLRKGGLVDALYSSTSPDGRPAIFGLLHAAVGCGQLEMVKELLKRGASIDLPSNLGATALMNAACHGHFSILLVLLRHSANPNFQGNTGVTALMLAAGSAKVREGQEACVKALLRAKANTELIEIAGDTALLLAEAKGHTAIAQLIRRHAAPPQRAAASPAAPPDTGEPEVSSPASLPVEIHQSAKRGELQKVVKWLRKGGPVDAFGSATACGGQITTATLLQTAGGWGHLEMVEVLLERGASVDLQSKLGVTALMNTAGGGHPSILFILLQHSANPDLQCEGGCTALMSAAFQGHEACVKALLRAKANTELLNEDGRTALQWAENAGHTAITKLIRQHAAPPPPAAMAPQAEQAAQSAQAARADAAMEELLAEEAAEQAKAQARSKKFKKKKAGRAAAAGDEPSEAPPAAAPAPSPAAAPKPAASAAARAEAALRAATAGGGLSALEVALAAAPREVREGGVGVGARARRDRLLEAQQEAEREAKQEAAAEAAKLAAERVWGAAVRGAVQVAAVSKAHEGGVAVAAVDALERATSDGGSTGAAGPSEASEAAEVPDHYVCPITAEIMTDPVCTADGFTYEREAISEWLHTKDTSPVTGATLESKTLIPNHLVRCLLRAFNETSEVPSTSSL